MVLIKLCEGFDKFAWQTDFILETVTLLAQYLYHSLDLLSNLAYSSINRATSSLISTGTLSQTFNKSW